jgi:hypothetical protein
LASAGHELMNQQNGVQMNGHLIKTLVQQQGPGEFPQLDDIVRASDRLVAESRRSVEMFARFRTLALAIDREAQSGAVEDALQLAVSVTTLLSASCGSLAQRVRIQCPTDVTAPAPYIVGLGALLFWLVRDDAGEIEMAVAGPETEIRWRAASESLASAQRQLLEQRQADHPEATALACWLDEQKVQIDIASDGAALVLKIAHGTLLR